jgi:hypothetical protein
MSPKFRIALLIMVAMLCLAACAPAASGPLQVKTGEPFKLSPGESATTESGDLTITFNSVTGDSRCPSDALCIQAGEAKVSLSMQSSGGNLDAELSTAGGDTSQVESGGYLVQLVNLEPYPISSQPIAPESYEVTLVVSQP